MAAALALGADVSAVCLLVAVAVVQGLLVLAWALAAGPPAVAAQSANSQSVPAPVASRRWPAAMPGRIGTVVLGAMAAAGADVAVSVRPHDALAPMLTVLGLAVPAMFIHQLTRGVVRARVVDSLSGIAVLILCVVALAALMQLRHESDGARMTVAAVAVAGAAIVGGQLVDLIWSRPRFDPDVARGLGAVVLAVGAGAGVGVLTLRSLARYTTFTAMLLGAGLATVAVLVSVCTAMIGAGIEADSAHRSAGRAARPVALAIVALALVSPVSYLLLLV